MKQISLLDSNKDYHTEKISGIIERITFRNEENGWSVIKVSEFESVNATKLTTVIVHHPQIIAGDTMDFYGEWITHPKFGKQFKASSAIAKKPASSSALEKYLGSGLIKGVGPKTAKRIVSYFGDETLEVFDNNSRRLMHVPGIGKKKLQTIIDAWEEHKSIKDIMIFLQSHGISTLYSVKIYKKYGDASIPTVNDNPYVLAKDIYGIGFFSADKIALSIGFAPDSEERIAAGIKHVLASSRENGHCYLTKEQMDKSVVEILELEDQSLIEEPLSKLIAGDEIYTREIEEGNIYYYSRSLYWDEVQLSRRIKVLLQNKLSIDKQKTNDWLENYSKNLGMELSPEQFNTIINIVDKSFGIITGGPGCGKTTITKFIVKFFEAYLQSKGYGQRDLDNRIMLAAPTGRAAQRMTETIGRTAKTIHRLLVWKPKDGQFEKNQENQLEAEILIVDEVSMLDISLAASLLKAVPDNCQVIFIGDADQLPSVGAGNVLHDLLECEKVPSYRLTKIFRQAQESHIITYAHAINSGKIPAIMSPIEKRDLFGSKVDCLFIDSEEATQEQIRFVKKAKHAIKNVENESKITFESEKKKSVLHKVADGSISVYNTDEIEEEYDTFTIPKKLKYVDLYDLAYSRNGAEELKSVVNRIPKHSTLNYGMTATQSIERLFCKTLPEKYPNQEIQILSPMVRGSLGTNNLNKMIQNRINPFKPELGQILIGDRAFRVNDRVIQNVNNYDLNVFNGDIGKIIRIYENPETKDKECIIKYDAERELTYKKSDMIQINLAYAITIHKSQGSEFPIIIIPLLTQHFTMLFRNLVYTGLTRARKLAVFVGSRKALFMAINRLDSKERQTTLDYLLSEI